LIQKEQGSDRSQNSFLPATIREDRPSCSNHLEQRVKSCILSHVQRFLGNAKRLVY
jgi:hypothetical protein